MPEELPDDSLVPDPFDGTGPLDNNDADNPIVFTLALGKAAFNFICGRHGLVPDGPTRTTIVQAMNQQAPSWIDQVVGETADMIRTNN